MRRSAFIMLTAGARRAAVEAETAAQDALIKAAPAEWEAYRNKGKETSRNKGYSLIKQVMLTEIPDAGPIYDYSRERMSPPRRRGRES